MFQRGTHFRTTGNTYRRGKCFAIVGMWRKPGGQKRPITLQIHLSCILLLQELESLHRYVIFWVILICIHWCIWMSHLCLLICIWYCIVSLHSWKNNLDHKRLRIITEFKLCPVWHFLQLSGHFRSFLIANGCVPKIAAIDGRREINLTSN